MGDFYDFQESSDLARSAGTTDNYVNCEICGEEMSEFVIVEHIIIAHREQCEEILGSGNKDYCVDFGWCKVCHKPVKPEKIQWHQQNVVSCEVCKISLHPKDVKSHMRNFH
jgi:hypothetical protein